jgi:hypothetical protein
LSGEKTVAGPREWLSGAEGHSVEAQSDAPRPGRCSRVECCDRLIDRRFLGQLQHNGLVVEQNEDIVDRRNGHLN